MTSAGWQSKTSNVFSPEKYFLLVLAENGAMDPKKARVMWLLVTYIGNFSAIIALCNAQPPMPLAFMLAFVAFGRFAVDFLGACFKTWAASWPVTWGVETMVLSVKQMQQLDKAQTDMVAKMMRTGRRVKDGETWVQWCIRRVRSARYFITHNSSGYVSSIYLSKYCFQEFLREFRFRQGLQLKML